MTTELTTRKLPTPTPEVAASLSPQDLREHRAGIASEVKVVLSAYFQPHESDEIKAAQLAWWCDELQDWTREQVVFALRAWNRDFPRARPTPGDIVALLKAFRGKREAEKMRAKGGRDERPNVERVSPERASQILAEVGFRARKFGGDE